MLTDEEYKDRKGARCPSCKSNDINVRGAEYPFPVCKVDMHCVACGHDWQEQYKFEKIVTKE